MGKSKGFLGSVAATAAAALILAGCAGGGGADQSSGGDDSAAGSIPKPRVNCEIPDANINDDPVDTSKLEGEITFMTQGLKGTFDEFVEGKIKEFEDAHPGTKINWTDQGGADDFDTMMVTQAGNCSMADVINVPSSTILALSKNNLLLDYDVKAPDYGDHFIPGVWGTVKFGANDHHTAYPWYFGPFLTTYNKDVFERAGLDPEKAPATMDEYFEFAHKIADANNDDFAVYGNTTWYMMQQWRAYGVKMMNEDLSEFIFASEEPALKWVENMASFYEKGAIPKDSMTGELDMSKAYGDGHLAFGTPNASFLRNVKANAEAVYNVTGVGKEALNEGVKPLFSGQFIAVSVTTPNAPLAVEFAKFFTSSESELEWAKFGIDTETAVVFPGSAEALKDPALMNVEGDDVFAKARRLAAEESLEAEAFAPSFYVTGQVQQSLVNNVNEAIVGKVSPQEALDKAQSEMNELLKKLNK